MIKYYFIQIIQHYGNIGILIGLILEYLGLPVPGETMLSFLGFLVSQNHKMSLLKSIIYSVSGTFIGSMIAYLIAYKFGEKIVLKIGRPFKITKEKLDIFSLKFTKRQAILLLFGRYILGIRHLVPYVGGISKMKPLKFILYNIAGSIIWCVSFLGLGYFLGDRWNYFERLFKIIVLVVVLIALIVFIIVKLIGKQKKSI